MRPDFPCLFLFLLSESFYRTWVSYSQHPLSRGVLHTYGKLRAAVASYHSAHHCIPLYYLIKRLEKAISTKQRYHYRHPLSLLYLHFSLPLTLSSPRFPLPILQCATLPLYHLFLTSTTSFSPAHHYSASSPLYYPFPLPFHHLLSLPFTTAHRLFPLLHDPCPWCLFFSTLST